MQYVPKTNPTVNTRVNVTATVFFTTMIHYTNIKIVLDSDNFIFP